MKYMIIREKDQWGEEGGEGGQTFRNSSKRKINGTKTCLYTHNEGKIPFCVSQNDPPFLFAAAKT